jgi:putative transposase
MRFIEHEIYHIYNRGNNKQTIFFNPANYNYFLSRISNDWQPACEIIAWCLMPNHFHLMIKTTEKSCEEISSYGGKPMQLLARKIGLTLSSYAQYINRQNKTTGSLFQQKTKAKCISSPVTGQTTLRRGPTVSSPSYIINCMNYIHQNPLKAKLVTKMEDWPYSSFAVYAGLTESQMCNKQILMDLTDYDTTRFVEDSYFSIEDADIQFTWQ